MFGVTVKIICRITKVYTSTIGRITIVANTLVHMIYLVIYLVRPAQRDLPQRDLELSRLVHEEDHPVVPYHR